MFFFSPTVVHGTRYEGRLEASIFFQVCVGPSMRGGWRPVFSLGVCWTGYEEVGGRFFFQVRKLTLHIRSAPSHDTSHDHRVLSSHQRPTF